MILSGAGLSLENALHGVRDSIRLHAASGNTALIEIDARSLAALHQWPWKRHLHAEAIRALEHAGARAIAFDVDFSAQSSSSEDRQLAGELRHSTTPIILATFRQYGSLSGAGVVENLPLPDFRENTQLAAVNIAADADGLVRHYPFGTITGGTPRPSIGAMLAGSTGVAGDTFPIDGAIDPDTIPRYSYVDLIRGAVPRSALAGKTVVIGATAIELGDRYSVQRYGVIPGPVIHLLAAETLLGGSAPINRGPVLPFLIALAIIANAARKASPIQIAASVFGGVALLSLPLALESANLGSLSIVPGLAALLAGFLCIATTRVLSAFRDARFRDAATGLPNRRGFAAETGNVSLGAVIAMRISNYSDVASLLGQDRAAELISRVGDRLNAGGIDTIYRLEEGALAWTFRHNTEGEVEEAVEGLYALFRAPFDVAGRQLELRCTFGIAVGAELPALILADRAILAADHATETGSRWRVHDAAMGDALDWRLSIAGELEQALAAGHIWVAYQPKLDIASGAIKSVEALVRWQHPTRGAIPPDAFIPSLEESGKILDLTLFVLHQAARDAAAWRQLGTSINVAVNVSALLATDEFFLTTVEADLDSGLIDSQFLTLEVTESAALADPDRAVAALDRLARHGIKLSIDDYGTGQSTLTYLKRLPAREIKIDKSFVLGLESNRSDQVMVRSTIELAHELGYSVVAEGVETAGILEMLIEMGCDTAQGWHIGKPVAAGVLMEQFFSLRQAA